jgi:hypothetical protein
MEPVLAEETEAEEIMGVLVAEGGTAMRLVLASLMLLM